MGTRHLIGVVLDGDFKVAQYGQWDGYPSGAGMDVLNFLNSADMEAFTENVRSLRWQTAEDREAIEAAYVAAGADPKAGWVTMDVAEAVKKKFPAVSRDTGADVLTMISEGTVEFLQDSRDFALDSLFCEWAYVVDLDRKVLECYEGFQKNAPMRGRWAGMKEEEDSEYYAVELKAVFALNDLPDADEFSKALGQYEDDDE